MVLTSRGERPQACPDCGGDLTLVNGHKRGTPKHSLWCLEERKMVFMI